MTEKEFNLIKEVIDERIKLDDIGPAVRLVTLYNRSELINDRVTERLYNWIKVFEKDDHKTKKEKHRLNVHKKLLLELNRVVDK